MSIDKTIAAIKELPNTRIEWRLIGSFGYQSNAKKCDTIELQVLADYTERVEAALDLIIKMSDDDIARQVAQDALNSKGE